MYQWPFATSPTPAAATIADQQRSDHPCAELDTLNQGVGPSNCKHPDLSRRFVSDFSVGECNIVFSDASTTIALASCKLDNLRLEWGAQGTLWHLSFFDRRWKWRFGQIGGRYNLYNPDQSLNTSTEKSPQLLASLCLEMMGETGYDVSNLPGTPC